MGGSCYGRLIEVAEAFEVAEGAGELAAEAEFELVHESEGVAVLAESLDGEADAGGGIEVCKGGFIVGILAGYFEINWGAATLRRQSNGPEDRFFAGLG